LAIGGGKGREKVVSSPSASQSDMKRDSDDGEGELGEGGKLTIGAGRERAK